MADPFYAEIKMFAGNFAPQGYAFCNGQILPITQNTALFSLIGTFYGGNGSTNFALPNLQGRAPMHRGTGPGLTPRDIGETAGTESEALFQGEMPTHIHTLNGTSTLGVEVSPANALWAVPDANVRFQKLYAASGGSNAAMGSVLTPAGGGQAHNNRQPYLAVSFIIAMTGIFPSRG